MSEFFVDRTYANCYIGKSNYAGDPYATGETWDPALSQGDALQLASSGPSRLMGLQKSPGLPPNVPLLCKTAFCRPLPPGNFYGVLIYDTPLTDADFNSTFAFLQSRTGIARRRLAEEEALPPPPPPPAAAASDATRTHARKDRRTLQQATLLQQDLTNVLAASAGILSSYVTATEVPLAGGTAFDCSLSFPQNATSLAIAFYGLINMYPNQIFNSSSWAWPVPVISSPIQLSGLALTWTAPPPPPIVRLPPPPPPPLSPPSPGPLVLTLAPSFAVSQWAVDQIACDSSGCTPYDRRIEYQPIASNVTVWQAMKGVPFSVVLTASRAISGVTTASLVASGFRVTQVVELSPGRQYLFDLVPSGTGNFSLSVPAGAVVDLGIVARRRLLGSSPAPASNSLLVAHDDTPPKPSFQYQ